MGAESELVVFVSPGLPSVWQQFPPRLAALLGSVGETFAVQGLSESSGERPNRLRREDAAWDRLIRAIRQTHPISVQAGSPPAAAVPFPLQLPRLAPKAPPEDRKWLSDHVRAFSPEELGPRRGEPADGVALRAGLFQWHDFLDESHQLSQSVEGEGRNQLGDYWHAIMHRREPDYGNAKYWFRCIGRHPLFTEVAPAAEIILRESAAPDIGRWQSRLLSGSRWDAFAFVDFCEACAANEESPLALTARRIQLAEMRLLLEMTLRQFLGERAKWS